MDLLSDPHVPRMLRPVLDGYGPAIRRARAELADDLADHSTASIEVELDDVLRSDLGVDSTGRARWHRALGRSDDRRGTLLDLAAALSVLEAEGLAPAFDGGRP